MIGDSWLPKWQSGGRQRHCLSLLDESLEGRLLEVGCADAALLHQLEVDNPSVVCVGVDVDVPTLRAAKRRHPELELVAAHAEALPFPESAFGTVVMLDVLEHVSDDHRAIREIARVLAAGRCLVLTTPHRGLFSWLDVSNLKLQLPGLYTLFSRLSGARSHSLEHHMRPTKSGPPAGPTLVDVLRNRKRDLEHRHYSLDRLRALLTEFRIERISRTGLLLFPMMHVIGVLISKLFRTHVQLFMEVAALEDGIEFGSVAYNIAVRAVRSSSVQ